LEKPGDQGGICRQDPLPPPPRDILQKTVYVEGLPKDATIEWLQKLIRSLTRSKPTYISVPYQKTGQSRGFAFIEFDSSSLAFSTVRDFNSKRATATAFLLQSSRRKMFQNSLRSRQLKILEPNVIAKLPPPCPRFMPKDLRLKFLRDRKTTSDSKNTTSDSKIASDLKSRKRRRDSDNDYSQQNGEKIPTKRERSVNDENEAPLAKLEAVAESRPEKRPPPPQKEETNRKRNRKRSRETEEIPAAMSTITAGTTGILQNSITSSMNHRNQRNQHRQKKVSLMHRK